MHVSLEPPWTRSRWIQKYHNASHLSAIVIWYERCSNILQQCCTVNSWLLHLDTTRTSPSPYLSDAIGYDNWISLVINQEQLCYSSTRLRPWPNFSSICSSREGCLSPLSSPPVAAQTTGQVMKRELPTKVMYSNVEKIAIWSEARLPSTIVPQLFVCFWMECGTTLEIIHCVTVKKSSPRNAPKTAATPEAPGCLQQDLHRFAFISRTNTVLSRLIYFFCALRGWLSIISIWLMQIGSDDFPLTLFGFTCKL